MVAVRHHEADAFLKNKAQTFDNILLHGADSGVVYERAESLITAAGADRSDPFQFVDLDGDALSGNTRRLMDEASTISLFGGRRIIRVRAGSKTPSAAFEPVLEEATGALVIVQAGELKPTSALRQLFEKSSRAAAIACYEDDNATLGGLIQQTLNQKGLRITEDGKAMLLGILGSNRASTRLELEKLCLYAQGEGDVTQAHIAAIMGDGGVHEAEMLIDAALAGDLALLEREAGPLLRQASNITPVLSAALRHFQVIRAVALAANNSAAEMVLTIARVQGPRKQKTLDLCRRWPLAKVDRAIAILADAQLQSRRSSGIAASLTERALWSIALAARR
jgi:DNA polymerase III subunit delta